jgi:hypothetical protein
VRQWAVLCLLALRTNAAFVGQFGQFRLHASHCQHCHNWSIASQQCQWYFYWHHPTWYNISQSTNDGLIALLL